MTVDGLYRNSSVAWERRKRSLAGGVASAIRSAQQPVPLTITHAAGAYLTDLDGRQYVDFALAYGPALLGHDPEPIKDAVLAQLDRGIGYGASHLLEEELSDAIVRTVPSAEMCVFSSSGSEAVLAALRIARSATGRRRIVKFEGHFHGWPDPLAIATPGLVGRTAASGGQDVTASDAVTVCPWNDLMAIEEAMDDGVAAIIMEPAACNGGGFEPEPGYLNGVRQLAARYGALLIFDEVITGYRLSLGGAQQRYGVLPDLTVLGKALGAGFPISSVCGRADVMEEVASGRVSHLGTFNAHPIAAAAAVAAIGVYQQRPETFYPNLEKSLESFVNTIRSEASAHGLPLVVNQVGAAAYALWSDTPVRNHGDLVAADTDFYRRFVRAMLDEGVNLIPRGLLYVSAAHDEQAMERALEAVRTVCARLEGEESTMS